MLDLHLAYTNHGVTVSDNWVYTAKGSLRIPPSVQVILILLLEAYPHTVYRQSLVSVVEEVSIRENAAFPEASIKVQLSRAKEGLARLGLSVVNIYATGYRLEINL